MRFGGCERNRGTSTPTSGSSRLRCGFIHPVAKHSVSAEESLLLPAPDLQFVEVALDRAAARICAIDLEVDQEDSGGRPAKKKARGHGGLLEGAHSVVVEFHPVVSDNIPDTMRLDLDMVPFVGRPVLRVAGDV